MKKLTLGFIIAISLGSVAFGEDLTGYISEAHCGAKHHEVSEANSKCVAVCLKGGSAPVLIRGGQVLTFDPDSKEKAKAFGGQNVKIEGSVDGSIVKVNSIQKAD